MDERIIGTNYPLGGEITIDRKTHCYILGATGVGKTELFLRMFHEDAHAGNAIVFAEPHGTSSERAQSFIPISRTNKVIVIDPTSRKPVGLNPLMIGDKVKAVENAIDIFKGNWPEAFLDRSEYLTRNYLKALCEVEPGPTLLHGYKMFGDDEYTARVFEKVTSATSRLFWQGFSRLPRRERLEAVSAPFNKFDKFFSSEYARVIFGHPKPLDLGKLINTGHIVIVRAAKGEVGEEITSFILATIFHMVSAAVFERQCINPKDRLQLSYYSDEHHNTSGKGRVTETALEEWRKYRANLLPADQSMGQIDERGRRSIMTNVGALLVARVSAEDAQALASELNLGNPDVLQDVPRGEWYVRRILDGDVKQVRRMKTTLVQPCESCQSPYIVKKQMWRRYGVLRHRVLEYADRILTN